MPTQMCTTRGMSFDPQQARLDRLRLKAVKQQQEAEAEKQKAREIREAYHEYSPAQIRQAGKMIHTCAKAVKEVTRVDTMDFLRVLEDFFPETVPSLQYEKPDYRPAGSENYVRVEIEACDPQHTPRIMTANRAAGL